MAAHFRITLTEWPAAVKKALKELEESPEEGETSTVDFRFGPPSKGRLPVAILIDGKVAIRCEISDTNKTFLQDLRGWMERSLVFDKRGVNHSEVLTIDCAGNTVLSLIMMHVGWDEPLRISPISFFVAIIVGREERFCLCDGLETIIGLYEAIIDCFHRHRSRFNNQAYWYDVKRFDLLNNIPTTDRLLADILSPILEIKRRVCKK